MNAALSGAAMVPVAGIGATGAKLGKDVVKAGKKGYEVVVRSR